eukprot:CAMPEP_0180244264 /NCGR_PEP_ID=MMETSP0987-20121128/34313_1 /TAXON_ID=697907 /ORGANISM="non described non described, Strain CCMP2293" /LENGTH=34 /DNA_ID= /DNA_START= /DNA_END= /DNA_ORIENTATION=
MRGPESPSLQDYAATTHAGTRGGAGATPRHRTVR